MINLNPIIKNETYKYSWLDKAPTAPPQTALILYPHDFREHCKVYFHEDIVLPEEIKRGHFDRLAHISLKTFEVQHDFRFPFSNGLNQWVDIRYKFDVSIRPDKDAVMYIFINNITDITDTILLNLESLKLNKSYNSLELFELEKNALKNITELLARLTYLKVRVQEVSYSIDDVSKKQIEDDKDDKIRQENVNVIRRKLARDKEEAEVRKKEAEIAREKAETERQMAQIRHQTELEQQQNNIELKKREVAAEKEYKLQQENNIASIAEEHIKNIEKYGLENLVAIDSSYEEHIKSHQAQIDLERQNKIKDLELAKQKILLIKEMVESRVIDEMTAGQMTKQILFEEPPVQTASIASTEQILVEEKNIIDISEDGKDDI